MTDFQFRKMIEMIYGMIEDKTNADDIKKTIRKLMTDENSDRKAEV